MRMTCLSVAISLALGSSAAFAQQLPGTAGETIGHPPSIAGPPSASDTSVAPRSGTAAPMGGPSEPTATGVNVSPAAPPASPGGSVPAPISGPGLNVVASDGISTKTVRAVPCGRAARETDGFTTCVGIPDTGSSRRRR
jgi:hypothetical protein